jgi:hypothetical protein
MFKEHILLYDIMSDRLEEFISKQITEKRKVTPGDRGVHMFELRLCFRRR